MESERILGIEELSSSLGQLDITARTVSNPPSVSNSGLQDEDDGGPLDVDVRGDADDVDEDTDGDLSDKGSFHPSDVLGTICVSLVRHFKGLIRF